MKTKSKLMPLFVTPFIAAPVLASTGCTVYIGGSTEEETRIVDTAEELIDAIQDPSVTEIDFIEGNTINIDASRLESGSLIINHDVTINGNDSYLDIYSDGYTNDLDRRPSGIYIEGDDVDVVFNDVAISYYNDNSFTSVINVGNIGKGSITIFDSHIGDKSWHDDGQAQYALNINPKCIQPTNINIKDSELDGFAAVYNQGSNITLNASNSFFYGLNYGSADDTFATIVVADFPRVPNTAAIPHCFGANNNFTFDKCNIWAKSNTASAPDYHQAIVEMRSIANNRLNLNSCSCGSTNVHDLRDIKDYLFLQTSVDYYAFPEGDEDTWIASYKGADKPSWMDTALEYYIHYIRDYPSTMKIDGTEMSELSNCGWRNLDIIGTNGPEWDYND